MEFVLFPDKLPDEPLSIAYPGSMLAQPLLTLVVLLTAKHHDAKTLLEEMPPRTRTKTPPCSMGEFTAIGRQLLRVLYTRQDPQCLLETTKMPPATTACTRS